MENIFDTAKKILEKEKEVDFNGSSSKDKKPMVILSEAWGLLTGDYKLMSIIGSGSFGQVVKAKHRKSGKTVAIKLIDNIFSNLYDSIKVVREVQIMRHLAQMKNN